MRTISAAEAATLRITGAPGGADFTLIPFNGSLTPSSTVALEFSGTQLTAAVGPPEANAGGATARLSVAPARRATAVARRDDDVQRQRDRVVRHPEACARAVSPP